MKKLFSLSLVVCASLLFSCMSGGDDDTFVLPELQDSNNGSNNGSNGNEFDDNSSSSSYRFSSSSSYRVSSSSSYRASSSSSYRVSSSSSYRASSSSSLISSSSSRPSSSSYVFIITPGSPTPAPTATGYIPSTVISSSVQTKFASAGMNINPGTTPPDISGLQYVANPFTLVDSNDDLFPGTTFPDQYFAFLPNLNGKISFRGKQYTSTSGSDNVTVEVVGSDDYFTAYFVETIKVGTVTALRATFISGKMTTYGIEDCYYAWVILDKDYDPSNQIAPINTYRIFKDGLASVEEWFY